MVWTPFRLATCVVSKYQCISLFPSMENDHESLVSYWNSFPRIFRGNLGVRVLNKQSPRAQHLVVHSAPWQSGKQQRANCTWTNFIQPDNLDCRDCISSSATLNFSHPPTLPPEDWVGDEPPWLSNPIRASFRRQMARPCRATSFTPIDNDTMATFGFRWMPQSNYSQTLQHRLQWLLHPRQWTKALTIQRIYLVSILQL